MKVNAQGIRANIQKTVTVYTLKSGNMRFGAGRPKAVRCSHFDIIHKVGSDLPGYDIFKIRVRRVKKDDSTEKPM